MTQTPISSDLSQGGAYGRSPGNILLGPFG
jgi:hypothetical protein